MKYMLISLKDRAIEAFQPVANVRAEGEALRTFKDLIANPQSQVHAHPDDYDLYQVGTFDDQDGQIEPCTPRKIADGKAFSEMNKTKGE